MERDLITIAQSIDESPLPALEEAEAGKVQRNQLEDGEISELDRLRRYYTRAIEVAARYAIALEEYVPHLAPQNYYSSTRLKYMRAQCRAAVLSHEDMLESRSRDDLNITWNGPLLTTPPSDLPDLEKEINRQKVANTL